MLAIFYRGTQEISRRTIRECPPNIRVRHSEPISAINWSADQDPAELHLMTDWQEVFERISWKCPNCECVIYKSKNWLELPQWALKQQLGEIAL